MGIARKILPNYTYQDYLRWKGRWEIIDGIAYDMSPMTSPEHQRIANKLGRIFDEAIDAASCDCVVYQPIDVKISESTVVNPDLLVVCKPIKGQTLDFPPELVIEIISPQSRLKDTITKYDLYEGFGVKYYIIIDPENCSSTVYLLDENQKFLEAETSNFILHNNCAIDVDINSCFTNSQSSQIDQ